MTARSVDIQNNTLASSPVKSPEDTLLKNFRATLDVGWNKFDTAVPRAGKSGPFASDDYAKVKAEYESAKKMLVEIKNDDELRSNVPMRQKLDETIKMLRKHNAESDKAEGYNNALVEMETNLAKLQQDVEKNNTTLPVVAVATLAGGALATEGMNGLSSAVSEGAKDLQKEVATIKKNPMKKIAEFFGFSDSSIASDIKEALAEKKAGGFDGFFASIKLWFYGFMAKLTGTDLAKSLSPEEMKLAGIKGKPEEGAKPVSGKPEEGRETIQDATKNILYGGAFSGLISFHQGFLSNITGEKDPSKNKAQIGAVYRYQSMYDLPYEKVQSLYTTHKSNPDNPVLLKELGVTDPKSIISPRDIFAALALIVDDKLMSTKTLQKNIGQNKNITVGALLTSSHGDWAIANDFEKIDPTLSANPSQMASQIFGNIGARFQVSKVGDTYKFGNSETQEQAQKIGAEGIVLTEIALTGIDINKIQDSEIDKQNLDPKSKELLRKLIAFWKVVKGPLAKDFSFGQESEYSQFYNTAKITPISLLKLYLVTGGNTEPASLASLRKMGVYAIIRESFFDGTPENKNKGASLFDKSIIKMVTAWATNPTDLDKYISKDVQEAMINISGTIADTVIDGSWGVAHRAWLALPDGWRLGAGVGITLSIMLIWRLRILKYVGVGAGIGAAVAAGTFATAVYAGLSTENRKKFPEEEIKRDATQGFEKLLAKTE